MRDGVLETYVGNTKINCKMATTNTGHYGIKLEAQDKKETEIKCLEEKENYLTTYAAIIRVHEVNNIKGEYQLINALK